MSANDAIFEILSSSNWVVIVGVEASASLGVNINISRGVIFDHAYNVGHIDTVGGGAGGIDLSAGGFFAVIAAPSIHALAGLGFEVGVTVPLRRGIYAGVGWTASLSSGELARLPVVTYSGPQGWIFSVGGGIGSPVDAHGRITFSQISSASHQVTEAFRSAGISTIVSSIIEFIRS
jgi:hypothetical protein